MLFIMYFWLLISIFLFCNLSVSAETTAFYSGGYSFTDVDGEEHISDEEDGIKILIYFEMDNNDAFLMLDDICMNNLVLDGQDIKIYAVEVSERNAEELKSFRDTYLFDGIVFCSDFDSVSYKYIESKVSTSSEDLLIVVCDSENNVRNVYSGYTSADTIFNDVGEVISLNSNPENLTVENRGIEEISLSWDYHPNASEYVLYRSLDQDANYEEVSRTSLNSYVDTELINAQQYYYKIRYTVQDDEDYVLSPFSSYISCSATAPAPSIKLSSDSGYPVIYSEYLEGTEGTALFRSSSEDGEFEELLMRAGAGDISFLDATAISGETYYYKVAAYKTVNDSRIYGELSEAVLYNR